MRAKGNRAGCDSGVTGLGGAGDMLTEGIVTDRDGHWAPRREVCSGAQGLRITGHKIKNVYTKRFFFLFFFFLRKEKQ